MAGLFDKAKDITGLGLDANQLYARAFEKGVLLNKFDDAADIFERAAKKFAEGGNTLMENRAGANALLYRYLGKDDTSRITPLLQRLQSLSEIERPKVQTETIQPEQLALELDCRLVEAAIIGTQNDMVRSRDLHKLACDKFQNIMHKQALTRTEELLTYDCLPARDGHNDKPNMRYCYHNGMYWYYEAMLKKDRDPDKATEDLIKAQQMFNQCQDQKWSESVSLLLKNWLEKSTCWVCRREIQGYQLHYSLCHADVTPYTQQLLEETIRGSVNPQTQRITVCTPCGSMMTYKAQAEADKVRQELNARLDNAVRILENRMNDLENRIRFHHH